MKKLTKTTLLCNAGAVCAAFEEEKFVQWGRQYITNRKHLYNKIIQVAKENNCKITTTEIKQATKIKQLKNEIEKLNRRMEKIIKQLGGE